MSVILSNPSAGPEGGIGMRHLLLPPEDAEAASRVRRLRELGLGDWPVPEFDDFAREMATLLGSRYAMVNFIDESRQYFAGLYVAITDPPADPESPASTSPDTFRVMPRDQGYCRYVIARRRALALEDISDFPRFAVDAVVDAVGIHSYLGAPLIDRTGMPLGTVCVLDPEPQRWGREGLKIIKSMAARLGERIQYGPPGSRGTTW